MLKGLLQMKKKGHNQEQENYKIKKLTGKGKETVKVGNHQHTNIISKAEIVRRAEYKCKIFEVHIIYQNLMTTASQKSIMKLVTRYKEGHYIMIKGSIQKEDKKIVNIHASNIGAPQYIKQKLTAINSNTIIAGGDLSIQFAL